VIFRQQVIVATPGAEETRRLSEWLETEGFEALPRSTSKTAIDALASQPFDLLIADAGFVVTGGVRGFGLARVRETPVIVLGAAADGVACAPLGSQIMFLERPFDRATFICTVTMALMDSRPERRWPRRAVRPFEATVNGLPSHIIDVSKHGVRLELPRDQRMVTPDFVMRVPMIGVGVSVQRRWVRVPRPDESVDVMWCGGQLHKNTLLAEQGWQRFIDTLVSAGQ
jgi:DNA-binding response OmpR family regulator